MSEKSLNVQNMEDAKKKVSDIEIVGNPGEWVLVCKASSKSQGWMKATKAMKVPNGCVIQVSTQQGDNVAEALQFVPGVYFDTNSKCFMYETIQCMGIAD